MKGIKRVLSLLLSLAMVFGMFVFPTSAANGITVSAQTDIPANAGEQVTVDISLSGNAAPGIGAFNIYVFYQGDVLKCTQKNDAKAGQIWKEYYANHSLDAMDNNETITALANALDNENIKKFPDKQNAGYKLASFGFVTNYTKVPFTANGIIGEVTFTVADDVESCITPIEIMIVDPKDSNSSDIPATTVNGSVNVNGVTPTLKEVKIPTDSANITVAGGDSDVQTFQATATSNGNHNITEKVTWSVTPEDQGVTIASNGGVSVGAKAKAGTYTITATPDKTNSLGEAKTATITVNRTMPVLTAVTLNDQAEATVTVQGGNAADLTVTAKAYDQFDAAMTDVTWSVSKEGNAAASDGVSMDASTGVITVQAKAKDGTYTVMATAAAQPGETGKTATANLTVSRTDKKATKVTITPSTGTAIEIPANGVSDPAEVTFTAKVEDQFDEVMTGSNLSWTVKDAEGNDVKGISITSDGTLTVSNEAKESITNTTGKELTVTATCGDAKGTAAIIVKRAAPAAATVKISRNSAELSGVDTVVMPVRDGADKTYPYTAKLYDQYGAEMKEETVTWSSGNIEDSTHVTFNNGTLTVKAGAVKGKTVEITATMGGKSAKVTVTVTDMEVDWFNVKSKDITYGDPNSKAVTLPAGNKGTAAAGNVNLEGTFSVKNDTEIQSVGDSRTVTVTFTVTTAGDYQGVAVTKDYTVAVAKKAVTVHADNKTKTYGETNPELTFTVPDGVLVGDDTKEDLGVTLICSATENTNAGDVEITGTASANNYHVTVDKGTLKINKADITEVTSTATDKTILANAPQNTSVDALKTYMELPTAATVTYGSGTEERPMTWTLDKAFNVKGAVYTFTGEVNVGTNFNATQKTATATLTVTPVKITKIETASSETFPGVLTVSKAQVIAEDASLVTLGLPEQVKVTYDNNVAAENVIAKYDKDIAAVKTVANQVTDTDKTIDVTLKADSFYDWATLDVALPKTVITIINKYVIPESAITFHDITTAFGTPYTLDALVIADGTKYDNVTYTYTYIDKDGKAVEAPTDAGTYTVTVTVENDNYKGTKSVTLTIDPKSIASADVTLPEDFSATYNKKPHTPDVTVKDGETNLVKDKDYTVAYANNENAGTATITITGKGNYHSTTTKTFEIAQVDLAALTPTIAGTAEAGKVLTATLAGVDNDEIVWVWTVGDVPAATSENIYVVQSVDSNKAITAKAKAKEGGNYKEETLASAAVTVAKVAVKGTVTIELDTDKNGDQKISAGDTVKAITALVPAVTNVTYQWYNDGKAIEGEDAIAETYTVAEGDKNLTVTVTPSEDYTGSVTSAAVEVGKSVLKGTVSITGTATVNSKLTASVSAMPATAEDYEIIWLRDGVVIPDATETTYTVTKEDQGKTITMKVTAKDGSTYTGELVSTSNVTIPAAAPDAPEVNASAGDGKVTVTWNTPADNGAPIMGYTLTGNNQSIDLPVGTNSYTFEGLTNDTEYTFKVAAKNSVNSSMEGEAKATPTASTIPDPPVTPSPSPVRPSSSSSDRGDDRNSGSSVISTSDGSVTVSAKRDGNGGYTVTLSTSDGKKLLNAADKTENGSLVLAPKVAKDAEKVSVALPVSTVDGLASSKAENIVIKTPVAEVALGSATLTALAKAADRTVNVTAEKTADGATAITVAADGENLDTVSGGVVAKLPVTTTANGMVAVLVQPDGSEKVVRNCAVVDSNLVTPLEGSATVKIENRSKSFADMQNHWAHDSVAFVSARELFVGTSDDTFSPNNSMTRGMLVTVLYRLDNEHKSDVTTSFSDVANDTWYTDAVDWAANSGVVTGVGNGMFAPNDVITREQMCTMLYRYASSLGLDSAAEGQLQHFKDGNQVSAWAREAMEWAVGIGLIQGRDGNSLAPIAESTRAEVATILERFVEFTVQ